MFRNSCFIAVALFCFSCVKDKPVVTSSGNVEVSGPRIFVLNEGNFGTGNASLSLYDDNSGNLVEDYYKQVNSQNLGDVLQSMTLADRSFYLVVNNSGKVVVCDKQLKKTGQISGLPSPRYFLAVDRHKAYISDYAANKIHIVDLQALTVTGSIPCSGWTEHLLLVGDQAIVTNVKSEYLYFINTHTDRIVDSARVGKNASGLVLDDLNMVWVLTAGDASKKIEATLVKIDPNSYKIVHQRSLGAESATSLCLNGKKDQLFYLNGNINKVSISDSISKGVQLISGAGKMFYGFGVHPDNGRIFAADAIDFSQKSSICEYDANGNEIRVFKAGIITNGFYFE